MPEEYQLYSGAAERALLEILAQLRITFFPGVASSIVEVENKGVMVKDVDGAHWNEAGHAVAASILAKHLQSQLRNISRKEQ
jgi:hypothetical protein